MRARMVDEQVTRVRYHQPLLQEAASMDALQGGSGQLSGLDGDTANPKFSNRVADT
jgi:hypothetical protein